jgi:hypothetical protein
MTMSEKERKVTISCTIIEGDALLRLHRQFIHEFYVFFHHIFLFTLLSTLHFISLSTVYITIVFAAKTENHEIISNKEEKEVFGATRFASSKISVIVPLSSCHFSDPRDDTGLSGTFPKQPFASKHDPSYIRDGCHFEIRSTQ